MIIKYSVAFRIQTNISLQIRITILLPMSPTCRSAHELCSSIWPSQMVCAFLGSGLVLV